MSKIAYGYDSETKKYTGEVNCQLDPLESEIARKAVYLLPGNATYVEPLPEKEDFNIIWDETTNSWIYKEIEKPTESEEYTPTELELAYQKYYEYKNKLAETDYINSKINDAQNWGTEEEVEQLKAKYAPQYEARIEYRNQVRYWEAEIERLKAEQTTTEAS